MSLNIVTVTGRLGNDPETRSTTTGKSVSNFRIAVDNGYGRDKKTDWFSCVAWEKTSELVQTYLKKGSKVAIVGRLAARQWEKDGVKRDQVEIVVNQVEFLDGKPTTTEPGGDDTESIPF